MSELIKWISVTDRFSKIYLNKIFEPLHINSSQHMFILKACENEGMTQDMLPSAVYINKSNVTRALEQLKTQGFIKKCENCEDKRSFQLYPTEKAKAAYPKIIDAEEKWAQILTMGFSEQEKEQVQQLLRRMGENAVKEIQEREEERTEQ